MGPFSRQPLPQHQGHRIWEGAWWRQGHRRKNAQSYWWAGPGPMLQKAEHLSARLPWSCAGGTTCGHAHAHTDNTVFSTPLQHCFPCLPPLPNHRDLKAALQAGGPLAALCCLSWALCWSSSGPAGPEIRRGARTGALPYTPPTSQDIQVTSFVRHLTQKGNSSPIGQKTLPSSIPPVNAGVPGQSALGVWPCWAAQPLQPHSSCSFTYS